MMRRKVWHQAFRWDTARSPPEYPFVLSFYPDVELPEQKEICAWGLLHFWGIKRYYVARYNELLTSGELNDYLYRVNEEAQERSDSLVADLAEKYELTEALKAKDRIGTNEYKGTR